MKSELHKRWETLRKDGEQSKKTIQIPVLKFNNKGKEIYFSYNFKSKRSSLIIELSKNEILKNKIPLVNGLDCKQISYNKGKKHALEIATEEIYWDLAEDYLNKIVQEIKPTFNGEQAFSTIVAFLENSKHFFASQNLDLNKITGLFGELYFLNKYIIDNGHEDYLKFWVGPDKNKFDFEIPDIFIEVKMKSHTKGTIQISNENQLDSSRNNKARLYLSVLSYNRVKSEKNSVKDIIAQIRKKINKKADLLYYFNECITYEMNNMNKEPIIPKDIFNINNDVTEEVEEIIYNDQKVVIEYYEDNKEFEFIRFKNKDKKMNYKCNRCNYIFNRTDHLQEHFKRKVKCFDNSKNERLNNIKKNNDNPVMIYYRDNSEYSYYELIFIRKKFTIFGFLLLYNFINNLLLTFHRLILNLIQMSFNLILIFVNKLISQNRLFKSTYL